MGYLKYRLYVYGRRFDVVTDHHALCWLANLKDPSGHVGGWSLRLQEFDVTIVYNSDRKYSAADCLSHAAVDPPPQNYDEGRVVFAILTESDLAAHQPADPELRLMIDYLKGYTVA